MATARRAEWLRFYERDMAIHLYTFHLLNNSMTSEISSDPRILNGKPIIKGTRISVEFILELLSSGMSVEDILKEYPTLKKSNILAAIDYAAKVLRHEEVIPTGINVIEA